MTTMMMMDCHGGSESVLIKKLCRMIEHETSTLRRDDVIGILKRIPNRSRQVWRQGSPLVLSVKKDRQDLVELLIESGRMDVNSRFGNIHRYP
jgi:hypothetical protein